MRALMNRLEMGLETELGLVLLILIGVFGLLLVAFATLSYRQKRRDILRYQHRAYYEKALEVAKCFDETGLPKAGFFGRETIGILEVENNKKCYGWCCIPTPQVADEGVRQRFRAFARGISHRNIPIFAPLLWYYSEDSLITVQGRLLGKNGQFLACAQEFLSGTRLIAAEVEDMLLELARGLASLHKLRAESGSPLYHGFLLPRSLFFGLGANRKLERLVVADLGMGYALGPYKLHQLLSELKEGKLAIERYTAQELLAQIPLLAPEQRDAERLKEVGQASDFYTYGCIAVSLFAGKRSTQLEQVEWEEVPERWQGFLRACLNDDPKRRPKDFLEIEDWLNDPELALTYEEESSVDEESQESPAPSSLSLHDLAPLIDEMREKNQELEDEDSLKGKVYRLLRRANTALEEEDWKEARKHFTQVERIVPGHVEALTGLAICHYEMGSLKQAEDAYAQAKEKDPEIAKRFRKHLTFRI